MSHALTGFIFLCVCKFFELVVLWERLQFGSPEDQKFHIPRVAAAQISRANGKIIMQYLLSLDNPWR